LQLVRPPPIHPLLGSRRSGPHCDDLQKPRKGLPPSSLPPSWRVPLYFYSGIHPLLGCRRPGESRSIFIAESILYLAVAVLASPARRLRRGSTCVRSATPPVPAPLPVLRPLRLASCSLPVHAYCASPSAAAANQAAANSMWDHRYRCLGRPTSAHLAYGAGPPRGCGLCRFPLQPTSRPRTSRASLL
jgi:hypothetical protein